MAPRHALGAALAASLVAVVVPRPGVAPARGQPAPAQPARATPGPRTQPALHAMAYDAARGRTVLYGGNSDGRVVDDTWEWDGARWRQAR